MKTKTLSLLLAALLGASFVGGCRKAQQSQPTSKPNLHPDEVPAPTDPVDPVKKPSPR